MICSIIIDHCAGVEENWNFGSKGLSNVSTRRIVREIGERMEGIA
jgi:hypothetical protein